MRSQIAFFFSWHPEPGATAVDVFSIYWANLKCYAFPPFSLLTQVLAKIRNDKALVLFIASVWTTQNWYRLLLQLLTDHSILLFRIKGQPSYIAWVSRALSLETQLTPIRIEVITCWQGLFWWSISRIISTSWPSATDQQYNLALKKWCCWCEQRKELIFFKHMLMR